MGVFNVRAVARVSHGLDRVHPIAHSKMRRSQRSLDDRNRGGISDNPASSTDAAPANQLCLMQRIPSHWARSSPAAVARRSTCGPVLGFTVAAAA
jgi:hypothetical protein